MVFISALVQRVNEQSESLSEARLADKKWLFIRIFFASTVKDDIGVERLVCGLKPLHTLSLLKNGISLTSAVHCNTEGKCCWWTVLNTGAHRAV